MNGKSRPKTQTFIVTVQVAVDTWADYVIFSSYMWSRSCVFVMEQKPLASTSVFSQEMLIYLQLVVNDGFPFSIFVIDNVQTQEKWYLDYNSV